MLLNRRLQRSLDRTCCDYASVETIRSIGTCLPQHSIFLSCWQSRFGVLFPLDLLAVLRLLLRSVFLPAVRDFL